MMDDIGTQKKLHEEKHAPGVFYLRRFIQPFLFCTKNASSTCIYSFIIT